jgi:hypothetical protein
METCEEFEVYFAESIEAEHAGNLGTIVLARVISLFLFMFQ